ncbi:MAG TPA: hypothetical protein VNB94_00570 [Mycobacteriales bacterium]|nr:hypothetical protein [Mycobacteriales bacterium]
MLFLLPIPVSLLLAMIWVSWRSRPRRPAEAAITVEAYRKALAVLAAPVEQRRAPQSERSRELVS